MTTFKGFVRSTSAAIRRAERAQQRRAREAAKNFKQQQKAQDIENAASAVEQYNEYIDVLKSTHKNCTDEINWKSLENEPKPTEPEYDNSNELKAINKINNYKPSLFDKWFSLEQKSRQKLETKRISEKEKDIQNHKNKIEQFKLELEEWKKLKDICIGRNQKDTKAYKATIEYFNPFEEISELGTQIAINFEPEYVVINLSIRNNEIIPNYVLTQTSTGKLSKKNMSTTKFNELYQDYICSCILRLSREILAYLPIEFVVINAVGEILNSSTGHIENQPILSVMIPPTTLDKLNFDTIDPSDSMKNFVHNMKFSKTNGFSPIPEVDYNKILK